jgi:predicted RNA-binding protein with PUA-like domain
MMRRDEQGRKIYRAVGFMDARVKPGHDGGGCGVRRRKTMAYWLMKSEPDAWSWDQQVKSGAKGTEWTGVRNHTAKLNLMKMKKGDRGFFYHSNEGKAVVGIVEIVKEHHPDPTADKGEPWVVVDVKAVEPVPQPVTLDTIKKEPKLKDMALVKY